VGAKLKRAQHEATTNGSGEKNRVFQTSGEIFPDGTAIELVGTGSATDDKLNLLFWDGKTASIAPQVERDRLIYKPPNLHASVRQAIRLPRRAGSYGKAKALFADIQNLFEKYVGGDYREAAALTLWVVTTWFPDCVPSPPQLSLSGPDMRVGVTLLALLNCLCRHPLVITDLTRHTFCSLVSRLQPTLLVSQRDLSPKLLSLWHATAFQGMFVPEKDGSLIKVTCSKALFHSMEGAACPWGDDALHLALPFSQEELPRLDTSRQREIADRFQPALLMYRLRNFRRILESAAYPSRTPNSAAAFNLAAYVEAEDDIAEAVAPLLRCQERDAAARRGCDVNRVIVEVIWAPSHKQNEISLSEIRKLTNCLLRERGEILEFSSEEVGRRMKNLGLYRHRNAKGMVLKLSRSNRARIHQLSKSFCLNLSAVDGCADCNPPEVVVN